MMKKKMAMSIVLMGAMVLSVFPVKMSQAKDFLTMSENKISIYKGNTKKVKLGINVPSTKVKKLKAVSSNRKVVRVVSTTTKSIKVKGIKTGTAKITVKLAGYNSCKVSVTVKKKPAPNEGVPEEYITVGNEAEAIKHFSGAGKRYYKDITKYPYLQGFKKVTGSCRKVFVREWELLPDKMIDALTKFKAELVFGTEHQEQCTDNRTGKNYIYIYWASDNVEDLGTTSLYYYVVQMYRNLVKLHYNFAMEETVRESYEAGDSTYGNSYNNLIEYYVKTTTNRALLHERLLTDEDLLDYMIEANSNKIQPEEVITFGIRTLYVGSGFCRAYGSTPFVTYKGEYWINGEADYDFNYRMEVIGKEYLRKLFSGPEYDIYDEIVF